MATDKLRFLTGNLSDLANKTIARGEVYFAIDGDNGKIVFDAPINSTTTKRIIMGNHVEFADKANSDSAGNEFISKYPFSFTTTTSTTTLKINVKAQNGDSVSGDPITIPAGTTSIAGLITTGTQSIKGAKTFTTSLTVSAANSFKYTGISASTANADTTVWFSHDTTQGTPVFSNNFKYNASSDTLTVGNVNGLAKQASQDSAGNDFISKYPFSFSTTSNGTSFKINIKAQNGDSVSGDPITVPNADASHAGIITNAAQNITGVKTFKTGVTIDKSSGFLYSGIESAAGNSARPVWFAYDGVNGKPVYNTNFTYNPSTKTLVAEHVTGTASRAIADSAGNEFISKYPYRFELDNEKTSIIVKAQNTDVLFTLSPRFLPLNGGHITGSLLVDDLTAGELLVNGAARVVGDLYANLTGNVVGNITGNVTGNLTGIANQAIADTAGHNFLTTYPFAFSQNSAKTNLVIKTPDGSAFGTYTFNFLPLTGGTLTGDLIIKKTTTNSNAYTGTGPQIAFQNGDASQNIKLLFTEYDTVQAPASLTLIGNQGGEYFIAPNIKATSKFYGNLKGNADTATLAATASVAKLIENTLFIGSQKSFTGASDVYIGETLYYVVGSDSDAAGIWTGTNSAITSYYEGLTIIYVPKKAGDSTTTLNINGLGAVTCYYTNTSKLTTHFAVNTPIILTYYNNGWRRADYDSNTNTAVRIYKNEDGTYPIIGSRTAAASITSGSTTVYGTIAETHPITMTPSTGTITATSFDGVATNATADELGNSFASTYPFSFALDNTKTKIVIKSSNGDDHTTLSPAFLPLAGGTMTGNITFSDADIGIKRVGRSKGWHKGRDGALVKTTSVSGYSVLASIKTKNGSWDIGAYDNASYQDDLIFSYITDTLYNGSNATTTAQIKFLENGHIVGNLDGTATQAQKDSSGNEFISTYPFSITLDSTNTKFVIKKANNDAYATLEPAFVKRAGDTMTGLLKLKASQYYAQDNVSGLDAQNSDLIGVNGIYLADQTDTCTEGLHFVNGSNWNTLWTSGNLLKYTYGHTTAGANGTTYNIIKAQSARGSESQPVYIDGNGDVQLVTSFQGRVILGSKTFTGILASENNQANGTFYFGNIKPTNYYNVWKIRYRVKVIIPNTSASNYHNYSGYFDVEIWGSRSTYLGYKIFNNHYNTSYRSLYYHVIYTAKEAGYSTYGHVFGIGLRSSNNPTTANFERTMTVDILEAENCTFEFFNTATKYASIPGTGSTNYNGIIELNGYSNGLQENGDADSYYLLRYQAAILNDAEAITGGNIIVANSASKYHHLKNGTAFEINYPILYAGSNIAANATGNNNYFVNHFNITTTQSGTYTAYKPIYIKGTLSGTTFTPISTTPLTQTIPESADGYHYILLGTMYSTTELYLQPEHPIFAFMNGKFSVYTATSSSADKAFADSIGNNFISKYPFTFKETTSTTNYKISIKAPNGDAIKVKNTSNQDANELTVPAASTTLAGLITTAAQTLLGLKTFTNTGNSDAGVIAENTDSSRSNKIGFINGASGNSGMYSYKHSKWVAYINTAGNAFFKGTADLTDAVNGNPATGDDEFTRVWFSYGTDATNEKKRAYDDTYKYNSGTHTLNVTQYRINDHGLISYDADTESIVFSFV